ncbi:hypothetical protein K469DRAFT_66729 [Zopfia rhizophila CBS 207.26]|uniref:Uncharacterized protein n=1 Tax=Zopfia rhizophila CBS 207.26 TaxID=1314779 RepID=A0A6A6DB01_9PEZI|nr:hypothetical protein K469DRAFT_66729 [Zopfia rhizophila CBS 207.26]
MSIWLVTCLRSSLTLLQHSYRGLQSSPGWARTSASFAGQRLSSIYLPVAVFALLAGSCLQPVRQFQLYLIGFSFEQANSTYWLVILRSLGSATCGSVFPSTIFCHTPVEYSIS